MMVMNEEPFEMNHVHPVCVMTLTLPVNAPALVVVALVGEIEKEQVARLGLGDGLGLGEGDCVTDKVVAIAILLQEELWLPL